MDEQNIRPEQNTVPPVQEPKQQGKKDGNGFGIASFVLGIVSLLLFCACVNWLTGILAVIFGIIQVADYKSRGLAIGGIVMACISFLLAIILYVLLGMGFVSGGYPDETDDFWDYYITGEAADAEETVAVFSEGDWHILL